MNSDNPLVEVFGYPVEDFSQDAKRARENKPCPFNRKTPDCRKDSKSDPLGTCCVKKNTNAVITCPSRFTEKWKIVKDSADFFFTPGDKYRVLQEYHMKDENDERAGNVDIVLTKVNQENEVVDFGAIEVQAVYISGNMRDSFEAYMEEPSNRYDMDWRSSLESSGDYPTPDWRSSHKRLFRQLNSKGTILRELGKKQSVVLQKQFYDSMPTLSTVPESEADLAWFIYDLERNSQTGYFHLNRVETLYTKHEVALDEVEYFATPDSDTPLVEALQRKLNRESDSPQFTI